MLENHLLLFAAIPIAGLIVIGGITAFSIFNDDAGSGKRKDEKKCR